jgi:hypothetical protein
MDDLMDDIDEMDAMDTDWLMGKGQEVGLVNGLGLGMARQIAGRASLLTLPIY